MAGLLKWVFLPGALAGSLQAGAATPDAVAFTRSLTRIRANGSQPVHTEP